MVVPRILLLSRYDHWVQVAVTECEPITADELEKIV